MAWTSLGVISAQVLFATQTWAAGSKTIGPTAIPAGIGQVWLYVDLTQLQASELTSVLTIAPSYSLDNGTTWVAQGSATLDLSASGYTVDPLNGLLDNGGQPVRFYGTKIRCPSLALTTRQIKATFTLSAPATLGMTGVVL